MKLALTDFYYWKFFQVFGRQGLYITGVQARLIFIRVSQVDWEGCSV